MRILVVGFLAVPLLASILLSQQTKQLSARELFYSEKSDEYSASSKEQKPAQVKNEKAADPSRPAINPNNRQNSNGKRDTAPKPPQPPPTIVSGDPKPVLAPGVQHLGLRYKVFLVDRQGRDAPTDPDRTFRSGERFAFEFTPNRSGYLYVVYQGSSGKWDPLFPAQGEESLVKAQAKVRAPYADPFFVVEDPPGVERIFVVLSRNPKDVSDLIEKLKNGVNSEQVIDKMKTDLASRDIRRGKVSDAERSDDPPNSVFVVSASPAEWIAEEIRLIHR